jgi:hypothetical protein
VSFDQGTCHHLGWGDSGDVTFAAEMIEPFCTCLGVLVAAHQRQRADGGTLLLTGMTPRIKRLLSLTRLEGVLLTTTGSDRNVVRDPSNVPARRRSALHPIVRPA